MKSMFAAVAAIALAGAANAQAARLAPAKLDPAAVQAGAAIVAQLGVKAKLQAQMTNSIAQMKSGAVIRAMLAQQPGFAPAYQANKAKFDPVMAKAGAIQAEIAQGVVNQNLNAVVAAAAQAYARQFTAAELNTLLAFYRTPTGQALIRKEPLVAAELANATGRLIAAKIDAAMQANATRLGAALAPLSSGAAQPGRKP